MTFVTDDEPDTQIPSIRMKTLKMKGMAFVMAILALSACGGGDGTPATPPGAAGPAPAAGSEHSKIPVITAADINLGDIDQAMVEKGRATYDVKCQACHSTSANRVVGPGWKGILERRKPEWVMNMVLNVDVMLDTDPEAQKLLEQCLVRMPNQNLSQEEARQVVEFMRTI